MIDDDDDGYVFLSNVIGFVSDKRIRVGAHWYEVRDVEDARVAVTPASGRTLAAGAIFIMLGLMSFPSRRFIAGIVDWATSWVPWRGPIDQHNALVNLIAFFLLFLFGIIGLLLVVSAVRSRFDLFVRLKAGLDMHACTNTHRGMLDAVAASIKHAVRAHETGVYPAAPLAPPIQAAAWTAYPIYHQQQQQQQQITAPPWDPRSLTPTNRRIAPAFAVTTLLTAASFTLAIAVIFIPHVPAHLPGFLWTFGTLLGLVAIGLKLLWVYRAWAAIPPWCRATATGVPVTPSEAVVMHFIPFFHFRWVYTAHIGACEATNAVLDAYGSHDEPRASPQLAFAGLFFAPVPLAHVITVPLLLGRHMMKCDAAQARMHELLLQSPPPQALQPPWEKPGKSSLIRYAFAGPLSFLIFIFFILLPGLSAISARQHRSTTRVVATATAAAAAPTITATAEPTDPDPSTFVDMTARAIADCGKSKDALALNITNCPEALKALPPAPRLHDYVLELDSAYSGVVRARKKGAGGGSIIAAQLYVGCDEHTCKSGDKPFAAPPPPRPAWHVSRGSVPAHYHGSIAMAFVASNPVTLVPQGLMTSLSPRTSSKEGTASMELYSNSQSDQLVAMSRDARVAILERRSSHVVSVVDFSTNMEQFLSRQALEIGEEESLSDIRFTLSSDGRVVGVFHNETGAFRAFDRVAKKLVGDAPLRSTPTTVGLGGVRISMNGREAEVFGSQLVVRALAGVGAAVANKEIAKFPPGVTLRSSTNKWAVTIEHRRSSHEPGRGGSDVETEVEILDAMTGAPRGKLVGVTSSKSQIWKVAECAPNRVAVARDFEVTTHEMPAGTLIARMSWSAPGSLATGGAHLACGPGASDVALIIDDVLVRPTPGL